MEETLTHTSRLGFYPHKRSTIYTLSAFVAAVNHERNS